MRRLLVAVSFLLGLSQAFAAEPFVKVCKDCTPSGFAKLTAERYFEFSTDQPDIYIIRESDWSISRFRAVMKTEYVRGEPVSVATVYSVTPDPTIKAEIQTGINKAKELISNGPSWYALDWGGYLPVGSAHDVVRDQGISVVFQQALERWLQTRALDTITNTGARAIEDILGNATMGTWTVEFPDGTTIEISVGQLRINNSTGEMTLTVNVLTHTAMDNGRSIPTSLATATQLNWPLLQGDQLRRFLATARAYGIPIGTSGEGEGMTCTWDGKTLRCIKSRK